MTLIAPNRDNFSKQLEGYYPAEIYPRNDGTFLVSYRRTPNDYQDSTSYVRYVVQDSMGVIIRGAILEQEDHKNLAYLNEKAAYPYLAISSFPFFSKSLFAVSSNDYLYTAQSKNFKIDVYNPDGERIREFSHPFVNKMFNKDVLIDHYQRVNYKSELGDGIAVKMIKKAENLPDTWPALQAMFFDDQDRLWVSTIVENDGVYEWWLLEKNGELITKFNWPRNKPIKEVKNGYMYTLETEPETDLQQIVRYRIEMDKE